MAQEIRVEIDAQGNCVVTTSGFAGKACQDATKQLEAAIGKTTADRATAEMSKPVTSVAKAIGGR